QFGVPRANSGLNPTSILTTIYHQIKDFSGCHLGLDNSDAIITAEKLSPRVRVRVRCWHVT
ncbi:36139_t:CDS:1, partial [Racocetra persica]